MRRFLVENLNVRDGVCTLTGPEARHMTRVLRMEAGDRFVLMDEKGTRFLAAVESSTPKGVRIAVLEPLPTPPPSPVTIVLCQALLKSGPMDYLIQKTSELGVNQIHPFSSFRSVVRLGKEKGQKKIRHWTEIARNATKQSGRVVPAEIGPVCRFSQLREKWEKSRGVKAILWEEEESRDLKGLLRASPPAERFIGMVGPEGGFSRDEISMAKGAGFVPVSLGNRILRSETAAITLVGIVQYEWGDLGRTEVRG